MLPTAQLAIKDGIDSWNRWRGNTVTCEVLTGVDLSGRDLGKANFRDVDLSHSSLARADLAGADLRGADLRRSNLRGANLRDANLAGAFLIAADFRGAGFTQTLFERTVFGETDLSRAKDLETCIHFGPSMLDFQTIRISGSLPREFLRGCGLPEALVDSAQAIRTDDPSCFISYSHVDKDFARRLRDGLWQRDVRCWLDREQLLAGRDLYDEIDRGIQLWDKLLLCCSESSLKSWWVSAEIAKAFEKERRLSIEHGRKIRSLIPLDLDGSLSRWRDGKAEEVRSRVTADFGGWETDEGKFEKGIDMVARALHADCSKNERRRRRYPTGTTG